MTHCSLKAAMLARRLLARTLGCEVLNTAYIERLNGTFRGRLAPLARRTYHLVHGNEMLEAGMYLAGMLYNLCTEHASLRLASGERRTPAMAAGLTEHCWSVAEMLWYRIAPSRWQPPKKWDATPIRCENSLHDGLPNEITLQHSLTDVGAAVCFGRLCFLCGLA